MVNFGRETIIDQRYQLEELLGEGGSGCTYRATRLTDGSTVAIKILSLQHLNDWKQLELFEREAQILSQLDHPQIPKYLEYFHVDTPTDRAFYIVQQLAPGQPLNTLVQSGWRGTPAEIEAIAHQLLEILQYLQAQSPPLIHRDLKPHNIIRNADGRVFLVDFGAVQATYHDTLMKGNTVAGTYGYMAPEQFRGRATITSDLYGLGATVLFLLTHRSPVELPQQRLKINFRSHVQVSESFADWLETMLEPDETDRFSSATQALQALVSQRYRRANKTQKTGFPWRAAAIGLVVSSLSFSLIHQYRYAVLTTLGLQPRDLCSSIARGDLTIVQNFLNHGGNVNATVSMEGDQDYQNYIDGNKDEGSLLHCAISANQVSMVQLLLSLGANVQSLDGSGRTPMQRIVDQYRECFDQQNCDNPATSRKLLQLLATRKNSFQALDRKNHQKESPLFRAVRQRKPTIVQQLIEVGADPQEVNQEGSSLFHRLARRDSSGDIGKTQTNTKITKIFNILVNHKVDFNRPNHNGDHPIHLAVDSRDHQVLQLLLQWQVDPNSPNKQGRTPLMVAIAKGNSLSIISTLLAGGANVNAKDQTGMTPSILLIRSQNWEKVQPKGEYRGNPEGEWQQKSLIAKQLFARGANPNSSDIEGLSPLHWLAISEVERISNSNFNQCAHPDLIPNPLFAFWLKQGGNTKLVDRQGATALHLAANSPQLVKQLVALGWDLDRKNANGENTLALMTQSHSLPPNTLKDLERAVRGENIKVQDEQGNTALHRFLLEKNAGTSAQSKKVIYLFVNLGADLTIKNRAGFTPLDLARRNTAADGSPKNKSIQAYINQCKLESAQLQPQSKRIPNPEP